MIRPARVLCGAWTADSDGNIRRCQLDGGHTGSHINRNYPYHVYWDGVGIEAVLGVARRDQATPAQAKSHAILPVQPAPERAPARLEPSWGDDDFCI